MKYYLSVLLLICCISLQSQNKNRSIFYKPVYDSITIYRYHVYAKGVVDTLAGVKNYISLVGWIIGPDVQDSIKMTKKQISNQHIVMGWTLKQLEDMDVPYTFTLDAPKQSTTTRLKNNFVTTK